MICVQLATWIRIAPGVLLDPGIGSCSGPGSVGNPADVIIGLFLATSTSLVPLVMDPCWHRVGAGYSFPVSFTGRWLAGWHEAGRA